MNSSQIYVDKGISALFLPAVTALLGVLGDEKRGMRSFTATAAATLEAYLTNATPAALLK